MCGVSGFPRAPRSAAFAMDPVDAEGDGDRGAIDPDSIEFDMPDTSREEMLDTVHDKRPIDKRFIDMGNGEKLFFPARYDPSCKPPIDLRPFTWDKFERDGRE